MCKFARKSSLAVFFFVSCLLSHFAFAQGASYKSVRIYQGHCNQSLAYNKDTTRNCPRVFAVIHKDDNNAYLNITHNDQAFISLSVSVKKGSSSTEYLVNTLVLGSGQPQPASGSCSLSSVNGDNKFQCNVTDQNANSWLFEYDHVSLLNETLK